MESGCGDGASCEEDALMGVSAVEYARCGRDGRVEGTLSAVSTSAKSSPDIEALRRIAPDRGAGDVERDRGRDVAAPESPS